MTARNAAFAVLMFLLFACAPALAYMLGGS
jgi:hypothetical protein